MTIKDLCLVLALLNLLSSAANGAQKINVEEEVKRMTEKFDQFEKPSPALINSVMDQFRQSCRTQRTINEEQIATNMSTCMQGLFNDTDLTAELQDAIPKGNLDNVFRNICVKWPKVKTCMGGALDIIEECWENGTLVNSGLDTMVNFFCGKNNDGALIALFFAEGGLSCLEKYGDLVRDCVNEQNTDEHQEDLCISVHQVFHCLQPLRSCNDVTPHNLVTSMIQEVGNVMKCPPPVVLQQYESSSALYSMRGSDVAVAMFVLLTLHFY